MSGALVAQAINESIGTAGFQGLDAILKEYLGLIAEQAGTARVPISRTINGHSLASDVDLDNNDVGAAPAGFGLGGNIPSVAWDDIDTIRKPGWYHVQGTMITVCGITFNFAYMRVDGSIDDYCTQTLYPWSCAQSLIMRECYGGTWKEFEIQNPPMQVGVEYRTTERWQGKPVYAKLIKFETLPNETFKAINVGIHSSKIVEMDGTCYTSGNEYCEKFPLVGIDGNIGATLWAEGMNVLIMTFGDYSGTTATVKIKYVKD